MKPLLLFCVLSIAQIASAQSPDYLSVRKSNGQVIKNFYTGSDIILQMTDGSFLKGPVQNIRNDSVYVTYYDIRFYATPWGTRVRDTIATTNVGVLYKNIQRVYIYKRQDFIKRKSGPILMIGGAGHLALNILNGGLFDLPITDRKNVRKIGFAAGAFVVGYFLSKLFLTDGFSKKKHRIVYVDL